MRIRKPWLAALLPSLALAAAQAAQPEKPAVFPAITAYRLDRQKITLPGGLEGQTDLLVISFAPEQEKDADSWIPAAQAVQHLDPQFRCYELPVTGRENFVFRWWETSSMRSDQTDHAAWHWIVPLFIDRQSFLRDLAIPNDKQIVALLVDRQGHILWRATGPLTGEKRSALLAAAGQH